MKGEINPQGSKETKMALTSQRIRVCIFLLDKLTRLVHLSFVVLQYDGIQNTMLDVVEGKTINIARKSHKVPHAQTKYPHKYIPLLHRPQYQQQQQGATNGIGLPLICDSLILCLGKLFFEAKKMCQS
jgi:hypothetical protein